LVNPTSDMFEVLLEQLRERLNENHSECIYTVGGGGIYTISYFSHFFTNAKSITEHSMHHAVEQ
jgi:hypothetical protein